MNVKPRKGRIGLIITGIVVGAIALAGGWTAVSFTSDNGPAPFSLPDTPAATLSSVDGQWQTTGGEVGYRAKEEAFGVSHEVVGRTDQVTGTATAEGGALTKATVTVPLTAFIVNGKPHPATSTVVDAERVPNATFTAEGIGSLEDSKPLEVTGTLAFNGQSHPVTWTVTPKATAADELALLGTTSIDVTQWGVTPPSEGGMFSIEKQVTLEFVTSWKR
ncbi:YceI family protein [Propioniciclava soli]|uniref:YceI family protein n=1 Tax=Propioniciclava soli TaxID=2775081 RepID=A0ABZ3CDS3_9ACTN